MRLLIDQNISPRLVKALGDIFPGSVHVQTLGLDEVSDEKIWEFARANDFIITAKDEDFNQLAVMRGVPPKILWIQLGNCTTAEIEEAIRSEHSAILEFAIDSVPATFVIRRPRQN